MRYLCEEGPSGKAEPDNTSSKELARSLTERQ